MTESPIRFGIIGTGWRAEQFARIARAIPARAEVVGVLGQNPQLTDEAAAEWTVAGAADLAELGRLGAEFVVAAASWPATPGLIQEGLEAGLAVLAETPPAPNTPGLYELWAKVGPAPSVQVAEQNVRMPGHLARMAVVRAGLIGEVTQAEVSSQHGYHAVGLLRHFLSQGFGPVTVTARGFTAPVVTPMLREGWTLDPEPRPKLTTIATLDFGDRMGLYDFTFDQWYNPLRTRRALIRGTHGEINDLHVVRLAGPTLIVESDLVRRQSGQELDMLAYDLESISHGADVVYANPFLGCRFADDELAIAETIAAMGAYVRGTGPEVYSLANACHDMALSGAIDEALEGGGDVVLRDLPWAK